MDSNQQTTKPFHLGLLLIDGFALMSYASVVEPLRAANLLEGNVLYQIDHLTPHSGQAASSGVAMIPTQPIDQPSTKYDLVLVIAGGDPASFQDRHTFRWLRQLAHQGTSLGGVSGGPVILAAAGVMRGYRMTLHWEHRATLDELYPDLLLQKALYVIDRERLTCAGGTAPLDMMHALLTKHQGPKFARQVSDWFMHTVIRHAGDPQRAGLAERYGTHSQPLTLALEAMENHIADPLDLEQLAALSGVSSRHLNRLFRKQFEMGCMAFYRGLRLDTAKNLLQQSSLPITEIVLATGFSSSAHFSGVFKGRFGVSPGQVRG